MNHLADDPTQPWSLPPQSLGGPVVAYPLFQWAFLPARHVTYTRWPKHVDIVHTCPSLPCLKFCEIQ